MESRWRTTLWGRIAGAVVVTAVAFCLGYGLGRYVYPHIFNSTPGEGPVYFGLLAAAIGLATFVGNLLRNRRHL